MRSFKVVPVYADILHRSHLVTVVVEMMISVY